VRGKPNHRGDISKRCPSFVHVGWEVEILATSDLRSSLADRRFEYVVAMDLLDRSCASQLLTTLYALLVPGGEMVFYESNPWNPVHKLREVSSAELVSDNLGGFLGPTGSAVVC